MCCCVCGCSFVHICVCVCVLCVCLCVCVCLEQTTKEIALAWLFLPLDHLLPSYRYSLHCQKQKSNKSETPQDSEKRNKRIFDRII